MIGGEKSTNHFSKGCFPWDKIVKWKKTVELGKSNRYKKCQYTEKLIK